MTDPEANMRGNSDVCFRNERVGIKGAYRLAALTPESG